MTYVKCSLVCLLALFFAVACEPGETAPQRGSDERPLVYTTFYPTTYFAERMLGNLAEVRCPVPDDADAIFWMPDAATIAEYQGANLIVVNGADFEKWVSKVNLPESRIVDTAAGFHDRFISYEGSVSHSHGPEGGHSHEGLDGHTWLAPELAVLQVQALQQACQRLLPGAKLTIDARARELIADLQTLDAGFAALQLPMMLASHPAYNYIARQYGWQLHNLDLDPDEVPTSEQVAEIQSLVAKHSLTTMLWEGAPRAETVQLLEKLGVASVLFSPCELLSASDRAQGQDYLSVMRANLKALQSIR